MSLPPLPEEFSRVLCVVAHPDDIEYGSAAAVAAWTARGVEVAYLLLTKGEAGMDASTPDKTAELRVREQTAAAHAVGVHQVDFLDHPDGVLVYDLDIRRDIALAIRRFRPDAVLAQSWEIETQMGFNQADHRVAGLATLDAVRDAGNRWVFTNQLVGGVQPWSPRWLFIVGDADPTHGVDVTGEPLERGIAALEAHAEYIAGLDGHPPVRKMLTAISAIGGKEMGASNAVLLRAVDLQAPPPIAREMMADQESPSA